MLRGLTRAWSMKGDLMTDQTDLTRFTSGGVAGRQERLPGPLRELHRAVLRRFLATRAPPTARWPISFERRGLCRGDHMWRRFDTRTASGGRRCLAGGRRVAVHRFSHFE